MFSSLKKLTSAIHNVLNHVVQTCITVLQGMLKKEKGFHKKRRRGHICICMTTYCILNETVYSIK